MTPILALLGLLPACRDACQGPAEVAAQNPDEFETIETGYGDFYVRIDSDFDGTEAIAVARLQYEGCRAAIEGFWGIASPVTDVLFGHSAYFSSSGSTQWSGPSFSYSHYDHGESSSPNLLTLTPAEAYAACVSDPFVMGGGYAHELAHLLHTGYFKSNFSVPIPWDPSETSDAFVESLAEYSEQSVEEAFIVDIQAYSELQEPVLEIDDLVWDQVYPFVWPEGNSSTTGFEYEELDQDNYKLTVYFDEDSPAASAYTIRPKGTCFPMPFGTMFCLDQDEVDPSRYSVQVFTDYYDEDRNVIDLGLSEDDGLPIQYEISVVDDGPLCLQGGYTYTRGFMTSRGEKRMTTEFPEDIDQEGGNDGIDEATAEEPADFYEVAPYDVQVDPYDSGYCFWSEMGKSNAQRIIQAALEFGMDNGGTNATVDFYTLSQAIVDPSFDVAAHLQRFNVPDFDVTVEDVCYYKYESPCL